MELKNFMQEQVMLMQLQQETLTAHSHNYLELVYIVQGEAIHTINGMQTTVREGDFFIIDYNTEHGYIVENETNLFLINCLFVPTLIDVTLKSCRSFETLLNNRLIHFNNSILRTNPANYIFHDEDGTILSLFNTMLQEYAQKQHGYIELIRCKLIELLILTMRKITDEEAVLCSDATISKITSLIEQRYAEDITLTMTPRWTTPDGRTIYVPNDVLYSSQMINYTYSGTRRIEVPIGVSYDNTPEQVRAAALDAISTLEGTLADPAPAVYLDSYGDSAINYLVQVWVPATNYLSMRYALNERIYDAFQRHGVEITYPHLNVHNIPATKA